MSEIEFGQVNDPNSWDTMAGTGVLMFATATDAKKAKELFTTLERELADARDKLKAEESPSPFCGHPGHLTDAEDENGANLFCWQCRNADLRAQNAILERELTEADIRQAAVDEQLIRDGLEQENEVLREQNFAMNKSIADLRAQVEALQQAKRPWTSEHTKSVIDGQVKEIDELTEKLRSERVKHEHEQEVEALTAERDRHKQQFDDAYSDVMRLHGEKMNFFQRTIELERKLESSERAAEALRADAERYRWIRPRIFLHEGRYTYETLPVDDFAYGSAEEMFDYLIDAARSGAKEAGNG